MANEELIYRITRAVYERFGENADEQMVGDLVTSIYRAVEPAVDSATKSNKEKSGTESAVQPFHASSGFANSSVVEMQARLAKQAADAQATNNGLTSSHQVSDYRAPQTRTAGEVPSSDGESASRLVVSVFGVDRPGIVAAVAQLLAEADCSIVDINQTVVQGKFAMVMIADMRRAKESAANLKQRFRQAGERIGIRIYAQREDLFNAMHRI